MQTIGFTSGAEISAEQLVQLRHLAVLLPLGKQKKVFNELSGQHSSALRGRGMDYAEVRQYQAGDDLRSMDWRVTARTGKPHIKLFQQEKERPVFIACDLRANMHFGSKRALKSVLAADLAALFAWASLHNGDRIGALLFSDQQEVNLRAKTGRKAVLHLINQLAQLPHKADSVSPNTVQKRMQQVFRHLRRTVGSGSRVYIISDWLGFDEACQQQLFHLSRHSDIVAIHLHDPLEQQLPPPGLYPVTDGVQHFVLESASPAHREQYQQAYWQRFDHLQQQLRELAIPLLSLSTETADPLPALCAGLGIHSLAKGTVQ